MPAHTIIHDGNPWWISPDIWVVPGNDPNAAPGSPIAGQAAYLWARVSNEGSSAAPNTRVDFYWANPAAAIAVGTATPIGSAYVDLAPGQTQEVLCLVPWVPIIVNGGHECVLAVAHAPGDTNPLPNPLPMGFPFDPPAHAQIAQLNLSVLSAAKLSLPQAIYVHALGRSDARARLVLEFGKALDPRLLHQLGVSPKLRPADGRKLDAGLSLEPHCGPCGGDDLPHVLDVSVPRGSSVPVFLSLRSADLGHEEYQLLHVLEYRNERLTGGVSFLIINPDQKQKED